MFNRRANLICRRGAEQGRQGGERWWNVRQAFSLCHTRDEWDAQMREWEETDRKMDEWRAQREAEGKSLDQRSWAGNFAEKAENEKAGGLPF